MTGAENQRSAVCTLVGHSVWVWKPENRWAEGWNHVQAPELRRDVPAQAGRSEADGHVLPSCTFCAAQVPVDGVMPVHMGRPPLYWVHWFPYWSRPETPSQIHPRSCLIQAPVASQVDTWNEPSPVTKRTSLSVHLRLCHGVWETLEKWPTCLCDCIWTMYFSYWCVCCLRQAVSSWVIIMLIVVEQLVLSDCLTRALFTPSVEWLHESISQ